MPTGCARSGQQCGGTRRASRRPAAALVVVTTPSGYASALAQAIDEGAHPGIAGTLAGDNTIFIAAKDGTTARELAGRARRRTSSTESRRDALVGPVGGSLDPSVWAFLHADDAELLPYDCEASLQHAQRLHDAGCSRTRSSPRSSAARRDRARPRRVSRRGRGRPQRDRAPARRRRAEDPRRPLAQRPGRGGLPALRARRLRRGP